MNRREFIAGGFVEGQNVKVLPRWSDGQNDRLVALAADLARNRVAVIVAGGSANGPTVAKSLSSTIPIVFAIGSDPVDAGLVASLNRPGGHVTGVTIRNQELTAKRLQLMHELVPAAASIGFLVNPTEVTTERQIEEFEAAAKALSVRSVILNASNEGEIGPFSRHYLRGGLVRWWWKASPFSTLTVRSSSSWPRSVPSRWAMANVITSRLPGS
jgi:putative tryptophan/tyrosine transport system substrate-binding protein